MVGHFPALVPGQCAHRLVGKALDAAGEPAGPGRLSCPGAGPRDRLAGGVLDQGRCSRWPRLGR